MKNSFSLSKRTVQRMSLIEKQIKNFFIEEIIGNKDYNVPFVFRLNLEKTIENLSNPKISFYEVILDEAQDNTYVEYSFRVSKRLLNLNSKDLTHYNNFVFEPLDDFFCGQFEVNADEEEILLWKI